MVGAFALTNGHGAFAAARIRRATLGWRTVAAGAAGAGGFLADLSHALRGAQHL